MKLQKFSFKLKNSTTFLLPEWNDLLSAYGLDSHMMPWDVSTRWNSTYDMLEFAVQYCIAIDSITAVHDYGLHKYKLVPAKWSIAKEL